MSNADIISISGLAEQTVALMQTDSGGSSDQLQTRVEQWVSNTTQVIQGLGTTTESQVISTQFGLSKQELAILLLLTLPVLDSRQHSFFSRLIKEDRASLSVVTDLVTTSFSEKNQLLSKLHADSPLFYWQLLIPNADTGGLPYLNTPLSAAQPIVDYLGGNISRDSLQGGLVSLVKTSALDLPFDEVPRIQGSRIINLGGSFEARRKALAFKTAASLHQPLYQINTDLLLHSKNPAESLKEALLFVALHQGILYWPLEENIFDSNPALPEVLQKWLALYNTLLITSQGRLSPLPPVLSSFSATAYTLPELKPNQNSTVWQALGTQLFSSATINYDALATTYTMNFERVSATLRRAAQTHQSNQQIDAKAVQEGYLATSPLQIANVATLQKSDLTPDELFLAPSVEKGLTQISKAFQNRLKISEGKTTGVLALLEGAKGSGKTACAECLANQLGLPLYRVDYLKLISTASDTETVTDLLFREAANNTALLLFDDADTLFDKNTQPPAQQALKTVLKQKLQEYPVLAIFTTHQRLSMDQALIDQAMITVSFPPLSPASQFQLFQKIMTKLGVKVDSKVQLQQLVNGLGANAHQVSNIVRNAILSASGDSAGVSDIMIAAKDLAQAIEIERSKKPE